jgi:hypothetical protein
MVSPAIGPCTLCGEAASIANWGPVQDWLAVEGRVGFPLSSHNRCGAPESHLPSPEPPREEPRGMGLYDGWDHQGTRVGQELHLLVLPELPSSSPSPIG